MPSFHVNPTAAQLMQGRVDYAVLTRETPMGRYPRVYIAWSRTREGPGRPDYAAAYADIRDMASADGYSRLSTAKVRVAYLPRHPREGFCDMSEARLTINGNMDDLLLLKQLLTDRKYHLTHDRTASATARIRRTEEAARLGRLLDGMSIGLTAAEDVTDAASRE